MTCIQLERVTVRNGVETIVKEIVYVAYNKNVGLDDVRAAVRSKGAIDDCYFFREEPAGQGYERASLHPKDIKSEETGLIVVLASASLFKDEVPLKGMSTINSFLDNVGTTALDIPDPVLKDTVVTQYRNNLGIIGIGVQVR